VQDNGATYMSLATTSHNVGANELYQSMGMQPIGNYHYRIKESA
jgi:ribosomal protein S18 acetylase RimI-like enzyme